MEHLLEMVRPDSRKKVVKHLRMCIFCSTFAQKNEVMDCLPKNPAILVSSINMLLRDEEFDSLESLCNHFDTNPEQIKAYLHEAGYVYSDQQEQFKPIGTPL